VSAYSSESEVTPQTEPSQAAAASQEAAPRRRAPQILALAQRQGLLLLLIALVIYLAQASPYFFTQTNMITIAGVAGILGVMAIVQTPLIVAGGLDISVGSTIAISSVWMIKLTNGGVNIWVAMLIAVLFGVAVGALNGVLVVWAHVNPLIATLGTMSIFSGLAYMTSISISFNRPSSSFSFLGNGRILSLPVPFLIAAIAAVVVLFIERFTVVGRSIYAIGGNRETARFAGLHVRRVPFLLYVFSGISAAVAGILLTAQLGSASPDVGATYTLQVVTAVILGGASLAGGRGTVIGTVVAVLFLGVLGDGFTLLEISSYAQTVILGIALIVAVLVDQAAQKLRGK
jgi:ribose transport system permease protein